MRSVRCLGSVICQRSLLALAMLSLGCSATDKVREPDGDDDVASAMDDAGARDTGASTPAADDDDDDVDEGGSADDDDDDDDDEKGNAPSAPVPTLVGAVSFSVPSQTFRDKLSVELQTNVAAAEIRYTNDGKLPTKASSLYSAAISLTQTTQLRAQAFVNGEPSGAVSTGLYIARTFDFSSDLPVVVLDGYGTGKPTDKDVYAHAAIMLFAPVNGVASIAAEPTLAMRAGYHVRGQSSARAPQTPYRVELWNNADEDEDYPILGMPADSDWVLIPPYYDRSLIHNPFVYELGREMGLEAPRTRFVEVYINAEKRPLSEADYQGVYWLGETIKNSKARTDLEQLDEQDTKPEQLSGGYIFKFDQAAAEEPKLVCKGASPIASGFGMAPGGGGAFPGAPMVPGAPTTGRPATGSGGGTCWVDLEVVDPGPLAPTQASWLTDYIQKFHDSLHASPIGDYASYIDVDSFVDYLIVNEFTRNVDSYVRSAYYHKDRDEKLTAGPLWDYNFSLAIGGASTIDPNGGWQFESSRNVNDWYPKLTKDAAFMARVRERFKELRGGLFADAALDKRIDALIAPLARAAARDFAKWPVSKVLPAGAFVRGPSLPTWPEQVEAMRTFVHARLKWMDGKLQ